MPNTLTEEQIAKIERLTDGYIFIDARTYIEQLLSECGKEARKKVIEEYEEGLNLMEKEIMNNKGAMDREMAGYGWRMCIHWVKNARKVLVSLSELQGVDSSVKEGENGKS